MALWAVCPGCAPASSPAPALTRTSRPWWNRTPEAARDAVLGVPRVHNTTFSTRDLKRMLRRAGVAYDGVTKKSELVALWRTHYAAVMAHPRSHKLVEDAIGTSVGADAGVEDAADAIVPAGAAVGGAGRPAAPWEAPPAAAG